MSGDRCAVTASVTDERGVTVTVTIETPTGDYEPALPAATETAAATLSTVRPSLPF